MKTTKLQLHFVGQKFGRLTVRSVYKKDGTTQQWCSCSCECGNVHEGQLRNIRIGRTKSCGCLNTEPRNVTHGKTNTKVYNCWNAMKARCYNERAKNYAFYGGRGITVSEEWRNDFLKFLSDIGEPPTKYHSIDRVNNDGNYEKSNCRWATKREQNLNKRYPKKQCKN